MTKKTKPPIEVATCEFCDQPASRRVTTRARQYTLFSCLAHHDLADARSTVYLGDARRTTVTNPTGFSLATGRMLGPGGCT